jgi:hypothetical protein
LATVAGAFECPQAIWRAHLCPLRGRRASAFPSRPSGGGGGGGGGGADWIVDGVVADAEGTPPAPRPFHAFQPAFCCLFVPFVGA